MEGRHQKCDHNNNAIGSGVLDIYDNYFAAIMFGFATRMQITDSKFYTTHLEHVKIADKLARKMLEIRYANIEDIVKIPFMVAMKPVVEPKKEVVKEEKPKPKPKSQRRFVPHQGIKK